MKKRIIVMLVIGGLFFLIIPYHFYVFYCCQEQQAQIEEKMRLQGIAVDFNHFPPPRQDDYIAGGIGSILVGFSVFLLISQKKSKSHDSQEPQKPL